MSLLKYTEGNENKVRRYRQWQQLKIKFSTHNPSNYIRSTSIYGIFVFGCLHCIYCFFTIVFFSIPHIINESAKVHIIKTLFLDRIRKNREENQTDFFVIYLYMNSVSPSVFCELKLETIKLLNYETQDPEFSFR